MFSEGYGCEMGDYKIDGIRFELNANPDFVKMVGKNKVSQPLIFSNSRETDYIIFYSCATQLKAYLVN